MSVIRDREEMRNRGMQSFQEIVDNILKNIQKPKES